MVRTAGREAEVSATLKAVVDGSASRTRIPGWRYGNWANIFTECRTGLAWRPFLSAQRRADF